MDTDPLSLLNKFKYKILLFIIIFVFCITEYCIANNTERFEGKFFRGEGDVEYLELLDISRRMFNPDPEFQNLSMLYTPIWNGFVEGPYWEAWWIQNSYGTTYCSLPFLTEPYLTFLQNSQDLWFNKIGDGETEYRYKEYTWVPPDGCLVDAATLDEAYHKQGDSKVELHDWAMEFTAAGALMQSELLLINRNLAAIDHYLPIIERCANFIESRRDTQNNLFLAGPASNLLAPSYAGWKKPDGTYGKAYLIGLSITYIAMLDRIIELQRLSGNEEKVTVYTERRSLALQGLSHSITDEGYFVKSIDPDGTKHGIYGADQYGYFESVCNHDAICFRIVDDNQAQNIYDKIVSIPELRPYDFIITNYPELDDTYMDGYHWLWKFGTWVNGGCWSTCEARMIMSYYRLHKFEDARRSMKQLVNFARQFKLDNPFTNFGSDVYKHDEPVNLVYDCFGPPAAMIRGLFEYIYKADGLILYPHIPPSITKIEQHFPIRFGDKKIYLAASGTGPITAVIINNNYWNLFDTGSVFLPYGQIQDNAVIQILMGGAQAGDYSPLTTTYSLPQLNTISVNALEYDYSLHEQIENISVYYEHLVNTGKGDTYLASHARLAIECYNTSFVRHELISQGVIKPLEQYSQYAADQSYIIATENICEGLLKQTNIVFVEDNKRNQLPGFALHQNYPNPFNPITTIAYSLAEDSQVILSIYNVSGQRVSVLKDEFQKAGTYSVNWNASEMPSGLYFCTLRAGGIRETRKMVVVR